MQKKFLIFFLANAAFIMALAFSSCSEKDEDIAAPSITFIHPVENDTVKLYNGSVAIEVLAQDHIRISDMEMTIKDQAGTVLFTYDQDDIESPSYNCHELFYPSDITKLTRMKLAVTFSNEYKNWTSKTISFYVKP